MGNIDRSRDHRSRDLGVILSNSNTVATERLSELQFHGSLERPCRLLGVF